VTDDSPADAGNPKTPYPAAPDGQTDRPAGREPPTPDAVPPTGDPRVNQILARLEPLDLLDVEEHAGVYADVHDALREALDSPSQPAPGEQREPPDAPPSAS
jgi:hypothetical protein